MYGLPLIREHPRLLILRRASEVLLLFRVLGLGLSVRFLVRGWGRGGGYIESETGRFTISVGRWGAGVGEEDT